jgi:hypothetical protein
MRRSLLTLTIISLAAWSQPTQPQPQPPIVVQIQTPPANPWMRLVELVIPGIIGAGLALFGVWYTNKSNAITNAANRQHDLEKLDRDHSFALKRDVLIRVTQLLVQAFAGMKNSEYKKRQRSLLEQLTPDMSEAERKQLDEVEVKIWTEYKLRQEELEQATASARLAITDDLWKLAQSVGASIVEADYSGKRTKSIEEVDGEIAAFTEAARKELGIVQIDA